MNFSTLKVKSMVTKIDEIQYSVEYILDAKETGTEIGDIRKMS